MLTYNTRLKKLILPEYGRNIQKMVEYCVGIPDREERNVCAYNIVETMENLFPGEGDPEEYRHKLWDQLAIMSDFKLDIDWPYPVIQAEELDTKPQPMLLPSNNVQYKQYGQTIINMIDYASCMPEGEERDALILLMANHMKKLLLNLNPDGVDDERIFDDLRHISRGAINILPGQMELCEFKTLPLPKKKKKK
ncbi:MAG: DUF4290 domain-containing protein [Bacteroidales bacterium]|nr:DUF4290 domain-containing protein [Bacteroidales bacterium]